MEIDLIFKIAAVGIIVAVLIVVLMMIIDQIAQLFDTIKTLFGFY